MTQKNVIHLPRGGDLGNISIDQNDKPNDPPLTEKEIKSKLLEKSKKTKKRTLIYPLLTKDEKKRSPIFLSKKMAEKKLQAARAGEFIDTVVEGIVADSLLGYAQAPNQYTINTEEDSDLRKIGNTAVYLIIQQEQECIRVCYTEKDCDKLL